MDLNAQLFAGLAVLFLCAGCLSSAPQPATAWSLESGPVRALPTAEPKAIFPATRLGGVSVMAPYDQPAFAVKRADGSVAFDAGNRFAAAPAALLRGPLMAGLSGDGRFGHVVPSTSIVSADAVVEVMVPELALDCTTEGVRKARAAVRVDVVKNGRSRDVALSGSGTAEADASSGDYGAAFSAAVNSAVANALSELK